MPVCQEPVDRSPSKWGPSYVSRCLNLYYRDTRTKVNLEISPKNLLDQPRLCQIFRVMFQIREAYIFLFYFTLPALL